MKLLQWFIKILLTVMLVSSLTLLTTGLIVQSYVKSLLASFNIQWEGQPMGLTAMFQGALGGKSSEEKKPGTGTTDQPAGAEEEHVPEDAISVMVNGTESGETGANTGNSSRQGTGTNEGQGAGSGTNSSATGLSPGGAQAREQTQMLVQMLEPIQGQQRATVQHRATEQVRIPMVRLLQEMMRL